VSGDYAYFGSGTVLVVADISNPASPQVVGEAARRCFSADGPLVGTGCYEPPSSLGGDFKGATVGTSPAFSFGSSVCELEVDPETGVVRIIKFTDAHDSGTVINPTAFHGQVEGSIVMGVGEVLSEDMIFDGKGRILNPNLHDYLIPSIGDTPEIESIAVPSYEPRGPYGAKEVGDGSMVLVLDSIAFNYAGPAFDEALEQAWEQDGFTGVMRRAASILATRFSTSYALPTGIASFYAMAQEHDEAIEWLERAFEVRDPNLPYIGLPVYDLLRSDPRFQDLVRRMNFPENS